MALQEHELHIQQLSKSSSGQQPDICDVYPKNYVRRGWEIWNGAMDAVRLPKILVLETVAGYTRKSTIHFYKTKLYV